MCKRRKIVMIHYVVIAKGRKKVTLEWSLLMLICWQAVVFDPILNNLILKTNQKMVVTFVPLIPNDAVEPTA